MKVKWGRPPGLPVLDFAHSTPRTQKFQTGQAGRPSPRNAGVTLIEVLVAITLLSLLSTGMMVALRIGLTSFTRVDTKLMDNRRVAGAQRIVEEELEGLMPVVAPCIGAPARLAFFQGEPQTMRFVSTFSLQEAWRGRPQLLEMFVIPGEEGRGVRLVVNEIPYSGAIEASKLCLGIAADPQTGAPVARFAPVTAGPHSFVLADKLAYCRFSYQMPTGAWKTASSPLSWPAAIRIEMAPLESDASKLQPITVVAPIHVNRVPEMHYGQ